MVDSWECRHHCKTCRPRNKHLQVGQQSTHGSLLAAPPATPPTLVLPAIVTTRTPPPSGRLRPSLKWRTRRYQVSWSRQADPHSATHRSGAWGCSSWLAGCKWCRWTPGVILGHCHPPNCTVWHPIWAGVEMADTWECEDHLDGESAFMHSVGVGPRVGTHRA